MEHFETKSQVFFVEKPYFKEAMMTFAFKDKVNWLEEGMSVASWKYRKVAEIDDLNIDSVYAKLRKWKGNVKSKTAGHRTIAIGDIVVVGKNVRIVTGRGWSVVPNVIWNKTEKLN